MILRLFYPCFRVMSIEWEHVLHIVVDLFLGTALFIMAFNSLQPTLFPALPQLSYSQGLLLRLMFLWFKGPDHQVAYLYHAVKELQGLGTYTYPHTTGVNDAAFIRLV